MTTERPGDRSALPGSKLGDFAEIVRRLSELVDHVGRDRFSSIYSLVPVAVQLLGLDNPLAGSGRSPFSIISMLPFVRDERVVKYDLSLTLEERRELIDEIYDMSGPLLLGEQDEYTALSCEVTHHARFAADLPAARDYVEQMTAKFELLRPLVMALKSKGRGRFAHIAHYGYDGDLERERRVLRHLSPELQEKWLERSFPTVLEMSLRGFRGEVADIRGWMIIVNNSTNQLLMSNELRKRKIVQCAKLAHALGANVAGMAGLIAYFGRGGYQLAEQFPDLGFTTGHAYTIGNILQIAEVSAARAKLDLSQAVACVVGAAGSIGSGCARLLAERGVKKLLLIDIRGPEALQRLVSEIRRVAPALEIELFSTVRNMRGADLTIVATNSPRIILEAEMVKPGGIVIDDSFPKNVPQTLNQDRPDCIALDGSMVRLPRHLDMELARNMPDAMDVPLTRMLSCYEIYGCLAETFTLAASDHRGTFGLGASDPALAKQITHTAQALGFGTAPLQFFGYCVPPERFERAARARAEADSGAQ